MKINPPELKKSFLVGAALFSLFVSNKLQGAVIYDFSGLNLGNLTTSATAGQDSWYLDSALGGQSLQVVNAPSGSSTTKVLSVAYGNTQERAIRQFGSDFFTGTETAAEMSFTFQMTNLSVGIQMALGNGSTPGTYINGNQSGNFGPRLLFLNSNQFGIQPKTSGGTFGTSVLSSAQTLTLGSWYTVTLIMDLTANGGNGLGSVSLLDVTSGVAKTVVTGVNLGLLNNSATTGPDDWNQVSIRMDQLSTSGPSGTMVLSQLAINAVPEPASWVLVLVGLGTVLYRCRSGRSVNHGR